MPVDYEWLRYVTLGQFVKRVGSYLVLWVGISVSFVLISLAFTYLGQATQAANESWLGSAIGLVPSFAWFIIILGLLTFTLSGESIAFPEVNLKQWLVLNIVLSVFIGLIYLASKINHDPAAMCAIVGVYEAIPTLRDLIEIGKKNHAREAVIVDNPLDNPNRLATIKREG